MAYQMEIYESVKLRIINVKTPNSTASVNRTADRFVIRIICLSQALG